MDYELAYSRPNRRDVLAGIAAAALSAVGTVEPAASRFQVFDALLYRHKPDLNPYGIQPLPTLYNLWRPGSAHDTIDEPALRSALAALPAGTRLYFIDIEYWPVLLVNPEVRDSSIGKLLDVARIARSAKPTARFGFYDLLPARTYWGIVLHHPTEYPEWLQANRALDPLAAQVDVLFPSFYTFYNDPAGWHTVAYAMISEARRYGKPVYPFLWSEFHDSNPELVGHEIPSDFWAAQLQFCRENADGVVLWGGYQRQWNENAAWWQTTLKVLSRNAR